MAQWKIYVAHRQEDLYLDSQNLHKEPSRAACVLTLALEGGQW